MRNCFLFLFILLIENQIVAQESIKQGSLSGHIQDSVLVDQVDVLVVLVDSNAQKIVKTTYTDVHGKYLFDALPFGTYHIRVETGFAKPFISDIFEINSSQTVFSIQVSSLEKQLETVQVTGQKPFIEKAQGKLIMNVDKSLTLVGQTALEALEKAPGVRISANDVISLNGKTGIRIQINGKNTTLDGADLANYLRGLQSSSIEKIELITNPSARNDAAGSALINIILKRDLRQGTNGSINTSYGQGIYPKTSAGVSLNHRNKKIYLHGNHSYAYRKTLNHLELNRSFYENNLFLTTYQQVNYLTFPIQSHILRTGLDYTLSKKSSLGLALNGILTGYDPHGNNVSQILNNTNDTIGKFKTTTNSSNRLKDVSTALYYKYDLDSLGSTWSVDVDFANYRNHSDQLFNTQYFDASGNPNTNPYLLSGDIEGKLSIYSLKSDLIKQIDSTQTIEAGLKTSYVNANNKLLFYDGTNGQQIYDSTKSNHFIYQENINAIYGSYSLTKAGWGMQLGLRIENTQVKGNQVVTNTQFDTTYTQLFPNIGFNYSISEHHRFELNYARRIDRPSYDQLNPFKFYLDPSTYRVGNPFLKPQSTHGVDFSYIFKSKYIATVGVASTLDIITEVIAPLSSEEFVTVQTNINLQRADIIYLNLSLPFTINSWWETQQNISSYLAQYSGNVANTLLESVGKPTFNIQSTQTFKISARFSAEMRAEYRFREIYAYDILKPIWNFSTGFQAKILKQKGSLRFNFTDILYSNIIRADVQFSNYSESFVLKRDTRVATLAFTYRFGNSKLQVNRKSNGGAEDLKRRAGSAIG